MFHDTDLYLPFRDPHFSQLHAVADQQGRAVVDTGPGAGEHRDVVASPAATRCAPEKRNCFTDTVTVEVAGHRQTVNDTGRRPRCASNDIRLALPSALAQRYRVVEQTRDR